MAKMYKKVRVLAGATVAGLLLTSMAVTPTAAATKRVSTSGKVSGTTLIIANGGPWKTTAKANVKLDYYDVLWGNNNLRVGLRNQANGEQFTDTRTLTTAKTYTIATGVLKGVSFRLQFRGDGDIGVGLFDNSWAGTLTYQG